MTNASHTMGPWEYCRHGWFDGFLVSTTVDDGRSPEGARGVAIVTDHPLTEEKREANARLIAASPDLLAVCKRFAKELNSNGVDERIPDAYPLGRSVTAGLLRDLMRALDKATGVSDA